MTDNDAMLAFAVKWRHWNGGPGEDIFVEFGIGPTQFFHRLRQLLTDDRRIKLTPHLIEELLNICGSRLHETQAA